MIKIKFNNEPDIFRDVTFSRDSAHVVTLKADALPQNTSGFMTFRASDCRPLGNFSAYITIFRVLEDGLQFSDDGSVWVDPPVPEPVPDPEPLDPQPSQLDRLEAQVMYTAVMTDTLIEEVE